MAKITWQSVPPALVWNRVKSLRKERQLNQAQVAVGAGISIATLYNIEHGYEETTTEETKKKLADFFDVDIEDIFPAEMIGDLTREEFNRLKQEQSRLESESQARLIVLRSFYPDGFKKLRKEELGFYERALGAMTADELGEVFVSGGRWREALIKICEVGRRIGLNPPKIKHYILKK